MSPSLFRFSCRPFFPRMAALAFALAAAGCAQHIGDSCVLSTDCSTQGDRQCDTSMPGGYCTVFNCAPNSCPDYAACYLFHPAVQGCSYNDRVTSRTGESFCMEGCSTNGDCRAGYECVDARQEPWNALLLDDNQAQKVCMPYPDTAFGNAYRQAPDTDAGVCLAYPDVDAAFPPLPDAGAPAPAADGGDAGAPVDSGIDATLGSHDAGIDATVQDSGSQDAASE
jgi:hypothetical protein